MAERKPVKPPLAKKAAPKSPAKKKSPKAKKKEIKKVNEVKDRDEAKHGSAMFDEKHQKTGKVIDDKDKEEEIVVKADDDTKKLAEKLVKAEEALKKAEEKVAESALDDIKVRDDRTKAHQVFQKILDELNKRANVLLNNAGIPR